VFAGGDGKSWSMMLKSSGLTTATWGTPLSIFLEFNVWPPSRMAMDRSQRKVESQPRQFPWMPIFSSLYRSPRVRTVS
jgi:hypothetical protein